jgi:hypothetical protein
MHLTGRAKSIAVSTIDSYYGSRKTLLLTNAARMSPLRIADKFSAIGISDAILVEYSTNFADYWSLSMFLATVNMGNTCCRHARLTLCRHIMLLQTIYSKVSRI